MPDHPPSLQTVGLTPGVGVTGPTIQDDDVCALTVFVFANDHANAQAYWEFRVLLRQVAGNPMTGIITQLAHNSSPAGATWTCTIALVLGIIQATCTGALGVTVDWLVTADDPLCMRGVFGA